MAKKKKKLPPRLEKKKLPASHPAPPTVDSKGVNDPPPHTKTVH